MHAQALRVHGALIAVSVIYGYFYVLVKLLLTTLQPAELMLLRFVLTAVIALGIERLWLKTHFASRRDFLKTLALGLLGVFVVQILVVLGLAKTTAFHSALIMATIPIFTTLFSILLKREGFQWSKIAGILLAFGGVVILLFFTKNPGTPLPNSYLLGDFIVLLNAMAFSWFLIGSQAILKRTPSFAFMAYCYAISGLLFMLLFTGVNWVSTGQSGLAFIHSLTVTQWWQVAYVVILASIGTYTLNNYALSRVSPSVVAVYIFIQPIVSAVYGNRLLGEPFNMPMAIATGITFAGVLLTSLAPRFGKQCPPALKSGDPNPASNLCTHSN